MLVKEKTALKTSVKKTSSRFVFGRTLSASVLKEKTSVNCELKEGAISCGMGIIPYVCEESSEDILTGLLPEPERFFPAWQAQDTGDYTLRVGALTPTGTLYVYNPNSDAWEKGVTVGESVSVIPVIDDNKVMKTAFVGKSGVYLYEVGKALEKVYEGATTGTGCFYKGRLFVAVKPFHVAYSAPYEPHNFQAGLYVGGEISFPVDAGEVVQMAMLKDKMYVFYERGIAVVEATGSAFDLRFEKKLYTGGNILAGSVGACGVGKEKLFFLAENGVYSFDGTAAKKVCENMEIFPKRNTRVCGQASFEGKYFVCFYDENGQKRGLVVDGESGEGYYAFAPSSVSVFDGRALCVADGKVQELALRGVLPNKQKYVWESESVRFEKMQLLKSVTLFGKGNAVITVRCGQREKSFALQADGENVAVPTLRGKNFSLRLELEHGATLQGVAFAVQELHASR